MDPQISNAKQLALSFFSLKKHTMLQKVNFLKILESD